jgi:hypothetical protein
MVTGRGAVGRVVEPQPVAHILLGGEVDGVHLGAVQETDAMSAGDRARKIVEPADVTPVSHPAITRVLG